jgi:isopenicillin N synthase-like dioxygenase
MASTSRHTVVPLPILDLTPFRVDEGSLAAFDFVQRLRAVCHGIGAFYLTGHAVDGELGEQVHAAARRFFALPADERREIATVRSPQFRGYTDVGGEYTGGVPDRRDELDIGRELPAPDLGPGDPPWLRLRGPNQWPAAVPELRTHVTDWMDELERVGRTLLRAVALALGQPADHFDPLITPHPEVLVKAIRYPAVAEPSAATPAGDDGPARQGVGRHRDTGFLTFVHQDHVGGLQVERDGELVGVPRLPGTLVVNLGEMLQLASRGYFTATVHQVRSPDPGSERLSVAYFFNPRLEATLTPVDLPPALAAEAPGGESVDPSNPIFANYGENSLKVRLRAHPDVARRHHADLLAAGAQ